MPLDPSIVLGATRPPAPPPSPLETLDTVAKIQDIRAQVEQRRAAADKARQDAADRAAMLTTLQETGGDVDKAIPLLYQRISPTAAAGFAQHVAETRNKALEGLTKETDLRKKQLDMGLGLLSHVTDDASYQVALPLIAKMSPEVAQQMGPTYDPARVEVFRQAATSAQDSYTRQKDALEAFAKGDQYRGIAGMIGSIRPEEGQQKLDGILAGAKQLGVSDAILQQFPRTYSPQTVQWAQQESISPEKRAELAGQAETRAQTERHQTVQEGIALGNLRVAQAREAREAAGGGAADLGVASDVRTTSTGRPYVDLSKYKGKEYGPAQQQARGLGAFGASAAESDALTNIETARQNLNDIEKSIGKLPSWAATRPVGGLVNWLEAKTQWDPDLAAWGTYRSAAIQAMRAMAGSKGLRINRSEIETAMQNDIPDITDTQATAKEKLARVRKMLTNQENGVMGAPSGAPPPNAVVSAPSGGGLTYQDYLNTKKK